MHCPSLSCPRPHTASPRLASPRFASLRRITSLLLLSSCCRAHTNFESNRSMHVVPVTKKSLDAFLLNARSPLYPLPIIGRGVRNLTCILLHNTHARTHTPRSLPQLQRIGGSSDPCASKQMSFATQSAMADLLAKLQGTTAASPPVATAAPDRAAAASVALKDLYNSVKRAGVIPALMPPPGQPQVSSYPYHGPGVLHTAAAAAPSQATAQMMDVLNKYFPKPPSVEVARVELCPYITPQRVSFVDVTDFRTKEGLVLHNQCMDRQCLFAHSWEELRVVRCLHDRSCQYHGCALSHAVLNSYREWAFMDEASWRRDRLDRLATQRRAYDQHMQSILQQQ
jgi:hypothetical protein